MPSLRKLAFHSNNILPKNGKDLTVFSTSNDPPLELSSDSNMEFTNLLIPNVCYEYIDRDSNTGSESDSPPTRKRQRLDHLSQEEKVLRRKLKNRVAAQSARDRKKAKMTELEEQVLQLEAQKKFLLKENSDLRKENLKLEEENAELKLRLSSPTDSKQTEEVCSTTGVLKVSEPRTLGVSESFEYAEGAGCATPSALDDALHLLASNSESDDLLDILEQCSDSLLQFDFSCPPTEQVSDTIEPQESECVEMVGSSSKGLESIKELIQFDHIYYKQEEDKLVNPDIVLDDTQVEASDFLVKESIDTSPKVKVVVNSEEYPVIHVVDSEDEDSAYCLKKPLQSPSSSDAGYDSSYSVLSPGSESYRPPTPMIIEDDWAFSELFPTLV